MGVQVQSPATAPAAPAAAEPPPRGQRLLTIQNGARALILLLLLSEGGLHSLGYGQAELYRPDPRVYWTLAPDQHRVTKVNHLPVITNAHGTRGPDFAVPKPPNTLRILALGDSRMFGWGLRDEDTYARRLESELRRRLPPGRRIEVINAGVDAWSYDQMRVFLRDVALAWQPDVVLVDDANPWTQFTEGASPSFVEAMERRVRLKNLLRRSALYEYLVEGKFAWLYGKLRVLFIPVDRSRPAETSLAAVSAHVAEQVRAIGELLRQRGIPGVLLYTPTEPEVAGGTPPGDARLDLDAKEAAAHALALPLVDPTAALRQAGPTGLYLDGDPHHLNARGSAVVAAALADALVRQGVVR